MNEDYINQKQIMSKENAKSFLSNYGEWIFRIILLAGVIANLYLTQNFVTRSEFQDKIAKIEVQSEADRKISNDTLYAIKLILANQVKIDDHETRLRIVESREIDTLSRVNALERISRR